MTEGRETMTGLKMPEVSEGKLGELACSFLALAAMVDSEKRKNRNLGILRRPMIGLTLDERRRWAQG